MLCVTKLVNDILLIWQWKEPWIHRLNLIEVLNKAKIRFRYCSLRPTMLWSSLVSGNNNICYGLFILWCSAHSRNSSFIAKSKILGCGFEHSMKKWCFSLLCFYFYKYYIFEWPMGMLLKGQSHKKYPILSIDKKVFSSFFF